MNGDTLKYVMRYTECGSDYKSFCLVAKEWFTTLREMFDRGDVFANHLLTLLKIFPDANWDHIQLSSNPNMRMWYVLEHTEKSWAEMRLSANSGILPDEIVSTKYYRLDTVAANRNITVDFVMKYASHYHEDVILAVNPKITLADVKKYPQLPIEKNSLAKNPNITWKDIIENPEYFPNPLMYLYNSNCSADDLRTIIDKYGPEYNEHGMITNHVIPVHPSVTIKDILNSELSLSLDAYQYNPNFDFNIVLLKPNYKWEWDTISGHPKVTMDIIEKYPHFPWVSWEVCMNPNVVWKPNSGTFVQQLLEKHPDVLCGNPKVIYGNQAQRRKQLLDICKNDVLGFAEYSTNPNITWRDVVDFPACQQFSALSRNPFRKFS